MDVREVSSFSETEEDFNFQQYFQVINKHKIGVLIFSFMTTILSSLVVMSLTPVYQATASLLLESESAKLISIEEVYGINAGRSEYYETQFEILKSRSLVERVVRRLSLIKHEDFDLSNQKTWYERFLPILNRFNEGSKSSSEEYTEAQKFSYAVEKFMEGMSISPVRNTQIVKIHFRAKDKELTTIAANEIASVYINSHFIAKSTVTSQATDWMGEQLDNLKNKLRNSEKTLQTYREKEKLVDISGVLTLPANDVERLSNQLADAKQELSYIRIKKNQLKNIDTKSLSEMQSIPLILNHQLVRQLKLEESRQKIKISELSERYGDKHPKILTARSEMLSIRQDMKSQIFSITEVVRKDYVAAKERTLKLTKILNKAKEEIQRIGRKQYRLNELEREVLTTKELYNTFLKRMKETKITSDFKSANARILDVANEPSHPVWPRKKLTIAIVFAISLMFAVFIAFFLEAINDTLRSTETIERTLKLPLIGVVPKTDRRAKKASTEGILFEKDGFAFSESIRSIRSSVVLSNIDKPFKTILVTSSVPSEGKTVIASNLALALGKMERVLLIEADLRRPKLAENLGVDRQNVGLAKILRGTVSFSDSVQAVRGIDVLFAGGIPFNPHDLLSSDKFAKTLDSLRDQYDRIVIDSPPVNSVSDPLMLSQYADTVIFVTKADSTKTKTVRFGIDQLLKVNASVLGVVLNCFDFSKNNNSEGYYDYYGPYGYSSDESQKLDQV